ncbi:MAG: hypothetical protein KIS87_05965 [Phycisphaeraceae bacterium]|nr:hypothetical protein [Phycisphaeraceae bacterium]
MVVLIADKFEAEGIAALGSLGIDVASEPSLGPETLPEALARLSPEVLIVRSTKVPAPALAAASALRLIVRAGAGVDNIDVPAASARRIAVCNCPGMNAAAVAELAVGLLIACDRRIPDQVNELRAGRWNKKEYGKARGLRGRTLGVVGVGAIGGHVVRSAQALGMRVVAWSRSMTPERAAELGVESGGSTRPDLLRMAAACDAVSVHVALTNDTRSLCDAAFFNAMKPGAIFVNTSRGAVVDEAALADAVRAKGIKAALDVYAAQPGTPEADFNPPIAALPGVYGTHHCGASTDQAQQAVADETVRIVRVFKETGRFENCVNAGEIR